MLVSKQLLVKHWLLYFFTMEVKWDQYLFGFQQFCVKQNKYIHTDLEQLVCE